ncbi:unnamed protein product [Sphenostylis stenocarpa]|uniref:Bifunctional inhibitor/plant lipid transfer protein/seed storage helical domain-containing protein n=1 Tax=Sphenostylis stenocarpa TaxID=92480 RepID=A0AA86SU69_9FABA|nr:unnamed protein product [Sphenostylis stenocarpa]
MITTSSSVTTTIIFTLILTLACCTTSAPSPGPETAAAPAPESNGCIIALANMSDCLTYVEDGSNLTKPDKGCCPELAWLVDNNPICLCELLGKPDAIGVTIDLNKALKLPSICGVSTPPVSVCSAVGVPVSLPPSISEGSVSPNIAPGPSNPSTNAPSSAPSSSSTNAPPSPGGPAPSSSDTSISPSQNKNGVSAIKASALTNFIFGLSTLFVSSFF